MATNFQDTLAVLKNDEQPITAEAIYSLSDLHGENLQSLTAAWGAIPVERRQTLIQRLIDIAETNFDMDFNAVARLALTDLDDTVRAAAVEAALIDESPDMLRYLM